MGGYGGRRRRRRRRRYSRPPNVAQYIARARLHRRRPCKPFTHVTRTRTRANVTLDSARARAYVHLRRRRRRTRSALYAHTASAVQQSFAAARNAYIKLFSFPYAARHARAHGRRAAAQSRSATTTITTTTTTTAAASRRSRYRVSDRIVSRRPTLLRSGSTLLPLSRYPLACLSVQRAPARPPAVSQSVNEESVLRPVRTTPGVSVRDRACCPSVVNSHSRGSSPDTI